MQKQSLFDEVNWDFFR